MKITEIRELSKKQVKVYIDEEFVFVLYKGEVRKYGIKSGEDLSEEYYHEILKEVLVKRVKLRCLNLLKSRSYTEERLRSKLKEGYYSEELIQIGIDYVKKYGYINDYEYVRQYIEYRAEKMSKNEMIAKLRNKGISKEMIQDVLETHANNDYNQHEKELIKQFLIKKKFCLQNTDIKSKNKLIAQLLRKGFLMDQIKTVICHFDDENYIE